MKLMIKKIMFDIFKIEFQNTNIKVDSSNINLTIPILKMEIPSVNLIIQRLKSTIKIWPLYTSVWYTSVVMSWILVLSIIIIHTYIIVLRNASQQGEQK